METLHDRRCEGGAEMQHQHRRWEARLGQLAVYPGYGVTRIEELRTQEVAGTRVEFLVLCRIEDDVRILIPREKVDGVGLRRVMGRKDAVRIWEILRSPQRGTGRASITWSRQFREYQDKLKTGSVFEVAEVLRDLLRLQRVKELSFAEHRVLDSARSLVVHELAAVQGTQAERVDAEVRASVR